MSIILEIFSNHNLIFNNYFQGITLLEEQLGIKIIDVSKEKQEIISQGGNAVFYANHNFFEKKFNEFQELYIFLTNPFCQSIKIYNHFIQYHFEGRVNLKYHIWEKLIAESNYNKEILYQEVLLEWNMFREFIINISEKLGGNVILYLNDGSNLSPIIEHIINGEKFNTVITELNLVSNVQTYENLKNNSIYQYFNNCYLEKIR